MSSPLPEGRWIDVDGLRTRYFEAGEGEPVVFIYGGNFGTGDSASSAYTWSNQVLGLSKHWAGRSTGPALCIGNQASGRPFDKLRASGLEEAVWGERACPDRVVPQINPPCAVRLPQ